MTAATPSRQYVRDTYGWSLSSVKSQPDSGISDLNVATTSPRGNGVANFALTATDTSLSNDFDIVADSEKGNFLSTSLSSTTVERRIFFPRIQSAVVI